MEERIKLSGSNLNGNERKFIKAALNSNFEMSAESNVRNFEEDIEKFLEFGFVSVLNSGLEALHISLILLGIEEGDEIICQSLAPKSSVNPILFCGAVPIFVDSERVSWNIDPYLLEIAINDRIKRGRKPKAIIAGHLYGMPHLHEEIQEISDFFKIPIIEDCSDSFGSKYRDRKCGSLGKYSILSFESGKIITTLGGGGLVCDSQSDKEKAKILCDMSGESGYDSLNEEITEICYDYQMSEVVAGIGRAQMEVIEENIKKRRNVFDFYHSELEDIKSIQFLDEAAGSFSNRWLSCILTETNEIRENIRTGLLNSNIDCCPVLTPIHLQPTYKGFPIYGNGTAEDLSYRGLCLPSGAELTQNNLNRIIENIKL